MHISLFFAVMSETIQDVVSLPLFTYYFNGMFTIYSFS